MSIYKGVIADLLNQYLDQSPHYGCMLAPEGRHVEDLPLDELQSGIWLQHTYLSQPMVFIDRKAMGSRVGDIHGSEGLKVSSWRYLSLLLVSSSQTSV